MTEEELARIRHWRDFANRVSEIGETFMLSRGVDAIDKLLAEVERLHAENTEMRQAADQTQVVKPSWRVLVPYAREAEEAQED